MNYLGIRRLRMMVRILKECEAQEKVLEMRAWAKTIPLDERKSPECRTSACAVGWYAQHPDTKMKLTYCPVDQKTGRGGWSGVAAHFFLKPEEAEFLFQHRPLSSPCENTYAAVIERIEKFITKKEKERAA